MQASTQPTNVELATENESQKKETSTDKYLLLVPEWPKIDSIFHNDISCAIERWQTQGYHVTVLTGLTLQEMDSRLKRDMQKCSDAVIELKVPRHCEDIDVPTRIAHCHDDCFQHVKDHIADFNKVIGIANVTMDLCKYLTEHSNTGLVMLFVNVDDTDELTEEDKTHAAGDLPAASSVMISSPKMKKLWEPFLNEQSRHLKMKPCDAESPREQDVIEFAWMDVQQTPGENLNYDNHLVQKLH